MVARPGHYEPVAREGLPYIIPPLVLALVFWWFAYSALSLIFLLSAGGVALFFRNPYRQPPQAHDAIVSPADGRVMEVLDETTSDNLPGIPLKRISIFMSVFNVHVNRMPVSGTVEKLTYTPGRFLDARKKTASYQNEKNSIVLSGDDGPLEVVQIAGLIARRISCWVRVGDQVSRGERFGLIHFGSRLDVYLPPDSAVSTAVGDRVKAGATVIAEKRSTA